MKHDFEWWIRLAYYVGIGILVFASLTFLPTYAWTTKIMAFKIGTDFTLGTVVALGVGAGALLAYLRRFG